MREGVCRLEAFDLWRQIKKRKEAFRTNSIEHTEMVTHMVNEVGECWTTCSAAVRYLTI